MSDAIGYLKGKSNLMIYEQFGDLKFKYRSREFCCCGYYIDTVDKNKANIAEYIRHQLEKDNLGRSCPSHTPVTRLWGASNRYTDVKSSMRLLGRGW